MVEILAELRMDADSLQAALLFPLLEAGLVSTEQLEQDFSANVQTMLRAVQQMEAIRTIPTGPNQSVNPQQADNLEGNHWMVGYASPTSGREMPWEYVGENGEQCELRPASRVIVNNAENYIACCLAGLGLIQIPRFDVQHLLASGELVEVMPQQRAAAMPIALLYPHRRQRSRRLAVLIEWLEQLMAPHLE